MLDEIGSLSQQLRFDRYFSLKDYSNVVIAGMGGSGIAGAIFSEICDDIPAVTVSNYHLPGFADENTAFIAISYSGNTEETIACFREAEKRGCTTYAITSGGQLSSLCKNTILVPSGLQPRSAVGYLLAPLFRSFCPHLIKDLEEASGLAAQIDGDHDRAKEIAQKIVDGGTTPVIMGYHPFASIAYRWQTQFNENAKMMAFSLVYPELDHNAIVGLDGSKDLGGFFFMHFGGSDPRLYRRISATMNLAGIDSLEIPCKGTSPLGRAINFLHFGDYLTYYAGIGRGADPREVHVIEDLKKQLA